VLTSDQVLGYWSYGVESRNLLNRLNCNCMLCVFVCVYVCVHACLYVCMYVYTRVCMRVGMCVRVFVCVYVRAYIHACMLAHETEFYLSVLLLMTLYHVGCKTDSTGCVTRRYWELDRAPSLDDQLWSIDG